MALCLSTNNLKKKLQKPESSGSCPISEILLQLKLEGATFTVLTAFPRANELFDGQMTCSDASANKFATAPFQQKKTCRSSKVSDATRMKEGSGPVPRDALAR